MVRLLVEKYIFDAGGMKDIDGGIVLSSLHDIIGSEDICQEVLHVLHGMKTKLWND